MDEKKNIAIAEGNLSSWDMEILEEKKRFRALNKSDQREYIHETACMFDFLQDTVSSLYARDDEGLLPSEGERFGMQLIFDYVLKRIRASEAAVEE